MNDKTLPQHPCTNKCPEYRDEQCKHCLIPSNSQELEFTPGDIVVYEKTASLYEVDVIIGDMLIVKHTVTGRGYKQHKSMFRSASPAELKAKKRLDAPVALFVEGE